jgi:hypothetical protein
MKPENTQDLIGTSRPVAVEWSSVTVALGAAEVVPVFGCASWLVKEIVAPGLSSKQTPLRELVPKENGAQHRGVASGRAPYDL